MKVLFVSAYSHCKVYYVWNCRVKLYIIFLILCINNVMIYSMQSTELKYQHLGIFVCQFISVVYLNYESKWEKYLTYISWPRRFKDALVIIVNYHVNNIKQKYWINYFKYKRKSMTFKWIIELLLLFKYYPLRTK